MHEQKRSGKAQLIASLLGKELLSFAKLEGEINVFRLLSGYYGHKRRKHQVIRIVVSLQLQMKPDTSACLRKSVRAVQLCSAPKVR